MASSRRAGNETIPARNRPAVQAKDTTKRKLPEDVMSDANQPECRNGIRRSHPRHVDMINMMRTIVIIYGRG
jgi:hypothetical protein